MFTTGKGYKLEVTKWKDTESQRRPNMELLVTFSLCSHRLCYFSPTTLWNYTHRMLPVRQTHLSSGDQSVIEALLHRHEWLSDYTLVWTLSSALPTPSRGLTDNMWPQELIINHLVNINYQVKFQMPTMSKKKTFLSWKVPRIFRLARDKGQISLWARPNSLLQNGAIVSVLYLHNMNKELEQFAIWFRPK